MTTAFTSVTSLNQASAINNSTASVLLNATSSVCLASSDCADVSSFLHMSLVVSGRSPGGEKTTVVSFDQQMPLPFSFSSQSSANESQWMPLNATFSIAIANILPIVSPRLPFVHTNCYNNGNASVFRTAAAAAVHSPAAANSSFCVNVTWATTPSDVNNNNSSAPPLSLGFDVSSTTLADALVPITVSVLGGVSGVLLIVVILMCICFRRQRLNKQQQQQQQPEDGDHHRRRVFPAALATFGLLLAISCVILVGVGLDERHDTFPNVVVLELYFGDQGCRRNSWSPTPFQVLFLDAAEMGSSHDIVSTANNADGDHETERAGGGRVCGASDASMWASVAALGLRWSRVVSLGDPVGSPGLTTRSAALCSSVRGQSNIYIRLRSIVSNSSSTSSSGGQTMLSLLLENTAEGATSSSSSSSKCTPIVGSLPWLPHDDEDGRLLGVSAQATCIPASEAPQVFSLMSGTTTGGAGGLNVWFDAQRVFTPVPVATQSTRITDINNITNSGSTLALFDRRQFFDDHATIALASVGGNIGDADDDEVVVVVEQPYFSNSSRNMNHFFFKRRKSFRLMSGTTTGGGGGLNVWFDAQRVFTPVPVATQSARITDINNITNNGSTLALFDRRQFFDDHTTIALASVGGNIGDADDDEVVVVVEQPYFSNSSRNMNLASVFVSPTTTQSASSSMIQAAELYSLETIANLSAVTVAAGVVPLTCNGGEEQLLPIPLTLASTCPTRTTPSTDGSNMSGIYSESSTTTAAALSSVVQNSTKLLRFLGAAGTAFNPSALPQNSEPMTPLMQAQQLADDDGGAISSRDPSDDPITIMWFQRIALNHGNNQDHRHQETSTLSTTVFSVTDTLLSFSQEREEEDNNSSHFSSLLVKVTSTTDANASVAITSPSPATLLQHGSIASDRLDYALRHGLLEDPSNDADLQDGSVLSKKLGTYSPRPMSVIKDALRGQPLRYGIGDATLSVYGRVTVTVAMRGCLVNAGDCADDGGDVTSTFSAAYVETTIRLSSMPSALSTMSASSSSSPTTLVWRFAEPAVQKDNHDDLILPQPPKDVVRELSGLSTIRLNAKQRIADGSWHMMGIVCQWSGGKRQCQLHLDGATSVSSLGWRKCAASGLMAMPTTGSPSAEAAGQMWAAQLAQASTTRAHQRNDDGDNAFRGGTSFSPFDAIGSFGEVQIGPTFAEEREGSLTSSSNNASASSSAFASTSSSAFFAPSSASFEVAHVVVLPAALLMSQMRSVMGVASLSSSQKSASYALSIIGLVAAGCALLRTMFDLGRSLWKDRRLREAQERRDKRKLFEGDDGVAPRKNPLDDDEDNREMSDIRPKSQEGGVCGAAPPASTNPNNEDEAITSATRRLRDHLEAESRRKNVGGQLSIAVNSGAAGLQQVSRSTAQATTTVSIVSVSSQISTQLHYLLASVLNVGQMLSIYFANWSWPSELTDAANQIVRWLTINWSFSFPTIQQYVIPALAVALTGAVALLYWAVIDNDDEEFYAMVQKFVGGGPPQSAVPPSTNSNVGDAEQRGEQQPLSSSLHPSAPLAVANSTPVTQNSGLRLPVTNNNSVAPSVPPIIVSLAQPTTTTTTKDRATLMAEMQATMIAQQSCMSEQAALRAELAGTSLDALPEDDPRRVASQRLMQKQNALMEHQSRILAELQQPTKVVASAATVSSPPTIASTNNIAVVGSSSASEPQQQRKLFFLLSLLLLLFHLHQPVLLLTTLLLQAHHPQNHNNNGSGLRRCRQQLKLWQRHRKKNTIKLLMRQLNHHHNNQLLQQPLRWLRGHRFSAIHRLSSRRKAPTVLEVMNRGTYKTLKKNYEQRNNLLPLLPPPMLPISKRSTAESSPLRKGMRWVAHLWTTEGRRIALDAHNVAFAHAVANVVAQASNPTTRGILGMSEMSSCRIGLPRRAGSNHTGAAVPTSHLLYFTASFTATLTRAPAASSSSHGHSNAQLGHNTSNDTALIFEAARKAVDKRCEDIRTRAKQRQKTKKKLRKLERQQKQHAESHDRAVDSLESGAMRVGGGGGDNNQQAAIAGGGTTQHHRRSSSNFSAAAEMSDEDRRGGGTADVFAEVDPATHAERQTAAVKHADGGVDDAVVVECYLNPEGNALDGGHRGFLSLRPLHDGVCCPHHGRRLGMAFEVLKHAHKYSHGTDDPPGGDDRDKELDGVDNNEDDDANNKSKLRRRCCAYYTVTGRSYRMKRGLAPCPSRHAYLSNDVDFFVCPKRGCNFTICEPCYEGTSRDLAKSMAIGALDALKRMGAVQVIGFVVILISQLILAPVMQTCAMVLFCHASYQCQFPGCYLAPSVTFLIYACLAALTLFVAVIGLTASLVVVTLKRKKLIVVSVLQAATEGRGSSGSDDRHIDNAQPPASSPLRVTWWVVLWYPLPNDLWRLLLDRDRSMLRSLYEPYRFRFLWFHPIWMTCRASAVLPAVFGDPDSLAQLGGAWGVEMAFLLAATLVPLYSDRWVTFMSRIASVHQVAQVSLNLLYQTYEDGQGLEASGVIEVPNSSSSSTSTSSGARSALAATMLWLFVAYCVIVIVVLLAAVVVPFLWQRHLRQREEAKRAKAMSRRAQQYQVDNGYADTGGFGVVGVSSLAEAEEAPQREVPQAPRGDPRGWRDRYRK
ncbi:membrane-associated protein, putative [Bodo saltans]|uniref:Membrane-associated protein, putative n=1 Tax=Bodo saltans TaxID=75058 RepID=A0A0S4JHR4_BODSA|nr:membrane-associated protein, putative [Bodo saltans]|eukprot:CUG89004.1 membrane-associated protein, putative [Bodo saltans]